MLLKAECYKQKLIFWFGFFCVFFGGFLGGGVDFFFQFWLAGWFGLVFCLFVFVLFYVFVSFFKLE